MIKFDISREDLAKLYIDKGMSQNMIASLYNVSHQTVSSWLIKYGLKTTKYKGTSLRALSQCSVDGCERIQKARGFCEKHYIQVFRHGRLIPEKEKGKYLNCSVES